MTNSKCKSGTPFPSGFSLSSSDCPTAEEKINGVKAHPYQSAVGALMYLSITTRPDIAYATSVLASHMHNPGEQHWEGVKHVMAYLNGTRDRSILYGEESSNQVSIYSDSDHAGDVGSRKSRTGIVSMLNGGPISWKSHLQNRVSLSSTEAEYYAASEAAIEAKWYHKLLSELQFHQGVIDIYEDNQSTIHLANNPVAERLTKQMEIRHYHLRECVRLGEVRLLKIDTSENAADVFTKSLPATKFFYLSNKLMSSVSKSESGVTRLTEKSLCGISLCGKRSLCGDGGLCGKRSLCGNNEVSENADGQMH